MILDTIVYDAVTIIDLIVATSILIIAVIISKIVTINLRRSLKEKLSKEHLEVIIKVIHYGIILVAVLSVLPTLGINTSGLLVAGGIAGLVIGFASQSVVGNLVSGLFLMIERPIKIGNQVDIEGIAGYVEDINIMSTIVRKYDGLYVRIPNQKVFTASITNYVGNVARRFDYVVGIRYSDDAERAIEIIKDLIEEHPFALKNPSSSVFVDNLGDNSVNILVRIWSPSTEWYNVKMDLLWKIKKTLEEQGIEIPFPQRTVWFANELKRRDMEHSEGTNSA